MCGNIVLKENRKPLQQVVPAHLEVWRLEAGGGSGKSRRRKRRRRFEV